MRGPWGGPDSYDRRGYGPRGPPPRGYGGPPGPPYRGGPFGGPGPMGPPHPQAALPPPTTIDREKVCPLLLRVFSKRGVHHRLEDYAKRGHEPVDDEVQIYTWPDATLRELADLVAEVRPEARGRNARLSFAFVYPDRRGINVMKVVGEVFADPARRGPDDDKQLHQLQFQTGDFLDVAIYA